MRPSPSTPRARAPRRGRPVRALALTLLVAAGIGSAACSGSSDDDAGIDQEQSTPNGGQQDDEATTTTGDGEGGSGATTGEAPEPDEILGSSTGQHPTDPLDGTPVPLQIDVTRLERNGDLVELTFVMTNHADPSTPGFEPYSVFDDPRTNDGAYSISGTALIDGEGQKAYLTVIDSQGACLCTGDMSNVSIPGGGSMQMSATFGGLPESLDAVDVSVPGFAPVTGVPISG